MEVQLAELIEQIKKEGVDAAKAEAESILAEAKKEAEKIVADAKARADKMLADAKAENERMEKTSEDAIRQAGRNLLISFRESVARELRAIIARGVDAAYSSEDFSKIIVSAVARWAEHSDAEDIALILNGEDLEKLQEGLLAALNAKMLEGVTLKASDSFYGGFRIAVENGRAYYDYSAETVVDMLSNYLSPKVVALLKEAE